MISYSTERPPRNSGNIIDSTHNVITFEIDHSVEIPKSLGYDQYNDDIDKVQVRLISNRSLH
jgi:hypothetical protein